MLDEDLIEMMQREIELGYGDGRLRFIMNWVRSGRPLFECDRRYLEKRFSQDSPNEEKSYDEVDRQITTSLENPVERTGEGFGKSAERLSNFQSPGSSNLEMTETGPDSILQQKKVVVEMRKNLHHILVTLDQLEERLRRTPSQEPKYEVRYRRPHRVSDVQRERPVQVSNEGRERPAHTYDEPREKVERREGVEQKTGEIKEKQDLRTLAAVLFIATIVAFGIYFAVLSLFGIPTLRGIVTGYGVTYDIIKLLLNWLVTGLIICSGAWAAFGLLYLKKTRTYKTR